RLTPKGRELGLVDDERWRLFEAKERLTQLEVARLRARHLKSADLPQGWEARVLGGPLARDVCAFDLLRRPEVSYDDLMEVTGAPSWSAEDDRLPAQVRTQIEVHARY